MTYESLAARTGIPLPPTFVRLLADGKTRYGDDLAD
ncbi:MAG: SMI1/KNR4 family protein, partial [Lysobacter sp.]|nr:SMI1/KNR4 family protein [Lysobacter sp.]